MNSNWLFNVDVLNPLLQVEQLSGLLAIHVLLSICVAVLAWLLLPAKYRFPIQLSLPLLVSFAMLMPVVGAVGLLLFVLPSLHCPKRQKESVLNVQEKIELPYTQLKEKASVLFNDGSLQDVLTLQSDEHKRLNALLSIGNMKQQHAIPILKKALHDPADDIRLLAYAMLDKYETQINTQLERVQEQLAEAQGAQLAQLHQQVARNYWELAYLGLAQGAVFEHVLERAQFHIQQAIDYKETSELLLLQGRIALQQRQLEQAHKCFTQALAMGMHKQHVIPYLAEIAYEAGRYHEIPALLAQLPEAIRQRYPFLAIMGYWHVSA